MVMIPHVIKGEDLEFSIKNSELKQNYTYIYVSLYIAKVINAMRIDVPATPPPPPPPNS